MTDNTPNPIVPLRPLWTLLLVATGCSGGTAETFENTRQELSRDVGTACLFDDEDDPTFPGFSSDEVSMESHSSCKLGSCVAYHFQGRVSCPEGQETEGECTTPSGEPVTVPVLPQLTDRSSDKNVFCSCRCDGPESAGLFCQCPSDYSCRPLLESIGSNDDVAGSYCLPVETPTLR